MAEEYYVPLLNTCFIFCDVLTICLQTPLTDADEIRALACRALVGLARSATATQIMSKLPIFNNGVSFAFIWRPLPYL